ncbi:hypothetical protein MFIFM68171_10177 [Madurella fahalii]|uniref:Glucose-methanol-choline oxidoreductase N-terminal domain-containing protein n=1 Tax=Madurella fahalii TaxID=1157608 RepID=A0ABQ0GQF0_9PEZI
MLPFYKKFSENFTAPDPSFAKKTNFSYDERVHGHEGPVQCSFPNFYFKGSSNWFEAAVSLVSVPRLHHSGSELCPLEPLQASQPTPKLLHLRRTHLLRVLFVDTKAVGAEFLLTAGGDVVNVNATKDVLLTVSAIHTPKILQRSAVGLREVLSRFNISVISDLPGVGTNFHDQSSIIVPYNYTSNIESNYGTLNTNVSYAAEQRRLHNESRTGAYVLTSGLSTNIAMVPLYNMTTTKAKCKETITRA